MLWIIISILSGLSAALGVGLYIASALVLKALGITDSSLNLPSALGTRVDFSTQLVIFLIILCILRGGFQFLVIQNAKVDQEMILLQLKLVLNDPYFHTTLIESLPLFHITKIY